MNQTLAAYLLGEIYAFALLDAWAEISSYDFERVMGFQYAEPNSDEEARAAMEKILKKRQELLPFLG